MNELKEQSTQDKLNELVGDIMKPAYNPNTWTDWANTLLSGQLPSPSFIFDGIKESGTQHGWSQIQLVDQLGLISAKLSELGPRSGLNVGQFLEVINTANCWNLWNEEFQTPIIGSPWLDVEVASLVGEDIGDKLNTAYEQTLKQELYLSSPFQSYWTFLADRFTPGQQAEPVFAAIFMLLWAYSSLFCFLSKTPMVIASAHCFHVFSGIQFSDVLNN